MPLQFYLATLFNDDSYLQLSDEACIEKSRPISDKLIQKWHNSQFTDFSIYQGSDYYHDLVICYYFISKQNVRDMLEYFALNALPYRDFSFFDDYNGFGFTTADLAQVGIKDITYFNDVDAQVQATHKLFKRLALKPPKRLHDKAFMPSQYDCVMCFDNVEHSKEPLQYLETICNLVKPNGYLAYSDGFTKLYAGHFPVYKANGTHYKISEMKQVVYDFLYDKGFKVVCKKDGQRLIIFQKA